MEIFTKEVKYICGKKPKSLKNKNLLTTKIKNLYILILCTTVYPLNRNKCNKAWVQLLF